MSGQLIIRCTRARQYNTGIESKPDERENRGATTGNGGDASLTGYNGRAPRDSNSSSGLMKATQLMKKRDGGTAMLPESIGTRFSPLEFLMFSCVYNDDKLFELNVIVRNDENISSSIKLRDDSQRSQWR